MRGAENGYFLEHWNGWRWPCNQGGRREDEDPLEIF